MKGKVHNMEIRIFENKESLAKAAASYFIEVLKKESKPVLGLATGSSPVGLYEKLIESYKAGEVTFKNVHTYNLDEYVGLSGDHPQSYRQFMNTNLFDHIDIDLKNTNIPNGLLEPHDSCRQYNLELQELEIDIQVLGIGSNGHIAFNEPGTSFSSTTHCVDLKEGTISDNARFFTSIDEVPKQAVTMGLANIMKAKQIILIATGEHKAEALRQMILGEITEELPASILQFHPNVVILTDREAAKKFVSH